MFLIAGLALITLCISLIQEQIGRSAAIALGVKNLVIEIDEVEIIPRRKNFLTSNETPEDISAGTTTAAVAVVPIPDVDGDNDEIEETGIPGEVNEEDNEEDNEDNEGDEEEKEEDNEEKEDEEEDEDEEEEEEEDDEEEDEDEEDEDEDEEGEE